jgi:hypothetical protein
MHKTLVVTGVSAFTWYTEEVGGTYEHTDLRDRKETDFVQATSD